MNEELVGDYIQDVGISIHDNFKIVDLFCSGELVLFNEKSECSNYKEGHTIPLLDIVAWVYSKNKAT